MPLDDVELELDLALLVLGHETRRAIFAVLWEASWTVERRKRGVRFEALRKEVGVESSQRLSYHLELMKSQGEPDPPSPDIGPERPPVSGSTRGQLVRQEADRYYIDIAFGTRIVQMSALMQPAHDSLKPVEVPWTCPHCEERVVATFQHNRLDLWCPEHDQVGLGTFVPGYTAELSPTQIVRVSARHHSRVAMDALAGFCRACHGPVDGRIVAIDHDNTPVVDVLENSAQCPVSLGDYAYDFPENKWREPFALERHCQQCGAQWGIGVGSNTCYRPAAAHFFADHGIDIYTEPMRYGFVNESGTVLSLDPLRVEVELAVKGSSRTFVVDDACRVRSTG